MTTPNDAAIAEARERFVSIWAQMGSAWGIPPTMAEVHALLFIVGEPLNTDDVMEQLNISRGSASTTLRALVDWGIVSRVRHRGERKEFFQAEQDVWKMFRTIIRERKKREFDPLLDALRQCRSLTGGLDAEGRGGASRRMRLLRPQPGEIDQHNARLDQMLEFISIINTISERFIGPSGKGLEIAAKLLGRAS